jgi:cell division septum initiation protein DivIVA
MPRKKREVAKPANVSVGNLSDISGNVNIAGRDIKTYSTQTTTGLSAGEIRQLFDQLYARIEARPETPAAAKEDLKADVKEIQTAVTEAAQKNEKVDEGFLSRRFRNIARMAPDLLDVVVATLTNPLAGLGVAVKKIAEKAKAETGGGS